MKTMKKAILITMVLATMSNLVGVGTTECEAVTLPLRVVVNGKKIQFPDAQPFIDDNGRTQVPSRFVAEALGAEVSWEGSERKASFVMGSKNLDFYIDQSNYRYNNQDKEMDTKALIHEERTYVPVRYVAEGLGAQVKWDGDVRTVYIDMKKAESIVIKDEAGNIVTTEQIGSFTVRKYPEYTKLSAFESSDERVEVWFEVNLLCDDVPQQKLVLKEALLQTCDPSTVDKVINHISKKTERFYELEEVFIYDKPSKRCIWIKASYMEDINVLYLTEENSKYFAE